MNFCAREHGITQGNFEGMYVELYELYETSNECFSDRSTVLVRAFHGYPKGSTKLESARTYSVVSSLLIHLQAYRLYASK